MKYRFSATWMKVIAYILTFAAMTTVFLGGLVTLFFLNSPGTVGYDGFFSGHVCYSYLTNWGHRVASIYQNNPDFSKWDITLENDNFRFILLDEDTGDVLASYTEGLQIDVPDNLADNYYLNHYDYPVQKGKEGTIFENLYVTDVYTGIAVVEESDDTTIEEIRQLQVLCMVPEELSKADALMRGLELYFVLLEWRMPAFYGICISALALLLLLVYFCCTAGHRPGAEELHGIWFDLIPLDVMVVMAGLTTITAIAVYIDSFNSLYYAGDWSRYLLYVVAGLSALCGAAGTLDMACVASFALRIKRGKWWRQTLCWRIWRFCLELVKKPFAWTAKIVKGGMQTIKVLPGVCLILTGAALIELFLFILVCEAWNKAIPIFLFTVYNLFLLCAVLFGIYQIRILLKAAEYLASGQLDYQLDTEKLYWIFRRHGENMNAIQDGIHAAVEQQTKSERLKTELITNVSHDIKTPLTSIVNYVDLLGRAETEAQRKEYLDVLNRQAQRLKRLTENLVEAAKASSGNIAVSLTETNLNELINQVLAEYGEKLEAANLEPVVRVQDNLKALADGKLLWRVMDNLMNNVIKYALSGTRVYLTAISAENRVILSVKNISRDSLNVSSDELMERFVRGDSSRHEEGNGLGLNIAQSLTQLQNGKFRLTVDGDLFKAEIDLQKA